MLRIGQIEGTATADKKYTDGSVAGGIAATRLRAAAFNAMQEELAHIVEEAGLTCDVNDMTQVLTGLRKLFLSRQKPFADIKADGATAVAEALANLGLEEAAPGVSVIGMSRNARMNIAAASSTATFTADELIVGAALGGKQYRLPSFNKTVNLAITGPGGMDTGAPPVTGFVALYAIYKPSTKESALLSVNATAAAVPEICVSASMPAGYTASALVALLPISSSQFASASLVSRNISITGVSVLSGNGAAGSLVSLVMPGMPYNASAVDMNITTGIVTADTSGLLEISPASNLVGARRVSIGASATGGTISNTSFSQIPIFNNSKTMYWHTLSASIAYTVVVAGYSF